MADDARVLTSTAFGEDRVSTVGESFLVGLIGEGVIPSLTPPIFNRDLARFA